MAHCMEPVDVSGTFYLSVVVSPSEMSSCSYVALSGSEYTQLSVLLTESSTPYAVQQGAAAFSAMFLATLTLYLIVRNMTEILRLVRGGLSGLVR